MTKKVKTKEVEKGMYVNYLQKAIENSTIAEKGLKEKVYNAAAVNAVHSAISAVDAYCVFGMGKRCASENHKDTVSLIAAVPAKQDINAAIKKRYESIIRIKNMAEYEQRLVKQKEAEKAVREVKELVEFVKKVLEG